MRSYVCGKTFHLDSSDSMNHKVGLNRLNNFVTICKCNRDTNLQYEKAVWHKPWSASEGKAGSQSRVGSCSELCRVGGVFVTNSQPPDCSVTLYKVCLLVELQFLAL